jgi:hypothetical protein
MNRRVFLSDSSMATLAWGFPSRIRQMTGKQEQRRDGEGQGSTSLKISEPVLPGTAALSLQGDLAAQMVGGIHQFLLRRWQDSVQERG